MEMMADESKPHFSIIWLGIPNLCEQYINQILNQNNIIINLSLKHPNTLYNICTPIRAAYRYNL